MIKRLNMIKPNTISLLAITFFLATASHLPARTWTDATTKRTLEGDYISSDATNVVIKSGGKPIKIAIARLSDADKAFIKQKTAKPSATPAADQDTYDSLTDELIVAINNIGDAFDSAKDKASGEAFVKTMDTIGDELESISARMAKLEDPSDAEAARIQEKVEKSTQKFSDQFKSFFVRFMQNDELGENVGTAMTEFQARMDKLPDFLSPDGKQKEVPSTEVED